MWFITILISSSSLVEKSSHKRESGYMIASGTNASRVLKWMGLTSTQVAWCNATLSVIPNLKWQKPLYQLKPENSAESHACILEEFFYHILAYMPGVSWPPVVFSFQYGLPFDTLACSLITPWPRSWSCVRMLPAPVIMMSLRCKEMTKALRKDEKFKSVLWGRYVQWSCFYMSVTITAP